MLQKSMGPTIYISACPEDWPWRQELLQHLQPLVRATKLSVLEADPAGALERPPADAQLWLILLSRAYLASSELWDELEEALHTSDRLRVVPIIIKPCDWQHTPLGRLVALPRSGSALSLHRDRDAAWISVVAELRAVVEQLAVPPGPPAMTQPAADAPPQRPVRPPGVLLLPTPRERQARSRSGAPDRRWAKDLSRSLRILEERGECEVWDAARMPPGADRARWLQERAAHAELVILLLSPAFFDAREHVELALQLLRQRRALKLIELEPCYATTLPPWDGVQIQRAHEVRGPFASERFLVAQVQDIRERLSAPSARRTLLRLQATAGTALLRAHDTQAVLALLGEPPWHAGESLLQRLTERVAAASFSADPQQARAALLACEIPGAFAALPIELRLRAPDLEHEVSAALLHLREPSHHSAGRLACDLLFLRRVAADHAFLRLPDLGEVALRTELPPLVVRALSTTLALSDLFAPEEPETLARVEWALLKLCRTFLAELPEGAQGKAPADLGWPLFQWLCRHLDALTPEQRRADLRQVALSELDIDASINHRSAAVLHALHGDAPQTLWQPSSEALEDLLLRLSSFYYSPLGMQGDWASPSSSNLRAEALGLLLSLNAARFFHLPANDQHGWLNELPHLPDATATALLSALADHLQRLQPKAQHYLREHSEGILTQAKQSLAVQAAACQVLLRILEDGEVRLERNLLSFIEAHRTEPFAAELWGSYLIAIGELAPERLHDKITQLLLRTRSDEAALQCFTRGVARAINASPPEVSALLRAALPDVMTAHPELRDNATLERLVQRLGSR